MRRAHTGRAALAAGAVAIVAVSVTGCIPGPPPVPQPTPAAPVELGETAAGEVREGMVPRGGTATVELTVDERSAVLIGATSSDGDDLTLQLSGAGVDVASDDAYGDLDFFAFEMGTRDPALAALLDPGEYTIDIGEWSDAPAGFQLQVLTGTTIVPAGSSADLSFAAGAPGIAIVQLASGGETLAATSDVDTELWAYVPESDEEFTDDDSGGDRNPEIELFNAAPQDIVVVVAAYDRDEAGTAQLTVE